jgi:hypothetical protein
LDERAGERMNDVYLVIHVRLGDPEALFTENRLI